MAKTAGDSAAPPPPPTSARPAGPLIGREWECRAAERALRGLTDGSARLVEVTGEPGTGKTRMLGEIAAVARSRGLRVLAGRAGLSLPLCVLVHALDDYLSVVGGEVLREVPSRHWPPLRAMFPSFPHGLVADPGASETPDSDAAPEGYRGFLAVRALLETLAAREPLVITLDDLHRADGETIELIRQLLFFPPRAPVLLAFAYRHRQAPALLRDAVETAHGLTRMPLTPLTEAQVGAFADERLSPGQRRVLHEKSGGNPCYLEALLDIEEPFLSGISDVEIGVPSPAIVSVVGAELTALPTSARLAASGAAVLAGGFEPGILGQVVELEDTQIYAAIDELVERDLIRPTPGTGRFAFRHALIRHAVYHNTPPGWRLGAHARAAAALEAAHAPAVARAPHLARVAAPGDLAALDLLADAAVAVELDSPVTAAQWRRAALGLLDGSAASGDGHVMLISQLARSLAAAGLPAQGCDVLEDALRMLPKDTSAQRGGLVALYASLKCQLGRSSEAQTLIRAELDTTPDPDGAWTAHLAGQLACIEVADGRIAEAVEHASQSLTLAKQRQTGSALICALGALTAADCFRGSVQTATRRLSDALPVLASLSDSELAPQLDGAVWIGWSEAFLERWHGALERFGRVADIARATGQYVTLSQALAGRVLVLCATGSLTAAAAAASEAVDVARASGGHELKSNASALRYLVAARAGDQEMLSRYTTDLPLPPVAGWFAQLALGIRAEVSLARGDPDGCAALSDQAGAPELATVGAWLRVSWYELLTRAALDAGRLDAAQSWALRAGAQARQFASPSRTGLGLLAHAHVLARREHAAAAPTAIAAARALTRGGMVVDAARARAVAGTALAACGELDRAQAVLRQAQQSFRDCGAEYSAERVAADLLNIAGRRPRDRRRRQPTGLHALTLRERQVAQLASEGLKNSEIARRLFVSEKTVEMHMSNVFAKLGVPNRTGVVRAWLRHAAS